MDVEGPSGRRQHSDWDCEPGIGRRGLAVRLGLRQVKGCARSSARIAAARDDGYASSAMSGAAREISRLIGLDDHAVHFR